MVKRAQGSSGGWRGGIEGPRRPGPVQTGCHGLVGGLVSALSEGWLRHCRQAGHGEVTARSCRVSAGIPCAGPALAAGTITRRSRDHVASRGDHAAITLRSRGITWPSRARHSGYQTAARRRHANHQRCRAGTRGQITVKSLSKLSNHCQITVKSLSSFFQINVKSLSNHWPNPPANRGTMPDKTAGQTGWSNRLVK